MSFFDSIVGKALLLNSPRDIISNLVSTIPPVYFITKVLLNKLTVEQNFINLNIESTTDLKQNCCSPTFVIFYIYISVKVY